MIYIRLGKSDLTVSCICMGCMGFGDPNNSQHSWTIDEAHSREIIKRSLDLGVNFFDTAIGYQSGTSEQYLGRALRDFAKRDQVVVAPKFLHRSRAAVPYVQIRKAACQDVPGHGLSHDPKADKADSHKTFSPLMACFLL